MNTDFLQETDLEIVPYMLKHMIKQDRQWRKTKPFHSLRGCEEKQHCIIHSNRKATKR